MSSEEADFLLAKGTRERIFNIYQVIEKAKASKTLYICVSQIATKRATGSLADSGGER